MNGADYAAAGRFTVADISVAYALMLTKVTGLSIRRPSRFGPITTGSRRARPSSAPRPRRAPPGTRASTRRP